MSLQGFASVSNPYAALGSALGSIGSSAISYFGSKKTAKMNYNYTKMLQDHQNAFTERMSNTAHQREVEDLRAAGLNPLLSANAGASTPAGGSSTFAADDPYNTALQTYYQTKLNKNELKNGASARAVNSTQAERNESERSLLDENGRIARLQAEAQTISNSKLPSKIDAEIEQIRSGTQANIANAKAAIINANANMFNAYTAKSNYRAGLAFDQYKYESDYQLRRRSQRNEDFKTNLQAMPSLKYLYGH